MSGHEHSWRNSNEERLPAEAILSVSSDPVAWLDRGRITPLEVTFAHSRAVPDQVRSVSRSIAFSRRTFLSFRWFHLNGKGSNRVLKKA